jgi:hypothetical protein
VLYAVFRFVSVVVADHASFRLIVLLLVRFVCVYSFLSTNLSSFLFSRMSIVTVVVLSALCGMLCCVVSLTLTL